MNNLPAIRSKIGISILILFSLISAFRLIDRTGLLNPARAGAQTDAITLFCQRFDGIRKELPPEGVIGYVTDINPEEIAAAGAEYFLTQYALSPVIVDNSIKYPLVAGNFHGDAPKNFISGKGLTLRKNFGNGVMLFNGNVK